MQTRASRRKEYSNLSGIANPKNERFYRFDQKVMDHFGDQKEPRYYDGALGGAIGWTDNKLMEIRMNKGHKKGRNRRRSHNYKSCSR